VNRVLVLALCWLAGLAPQASAAVSTLSFPADDGVQLEATVWDPSGRAAPAVVMVPTPTRTRAEWARLGEQLAARGIVALAFDMRGHGGSQGFDSGEDRGGLARDVAAAVRYLQSRSDVQVGRVGLVGASMGATLAVIAAGASPAVRSLALLSPALDFRGLRIEEPLRRAGDRPALIVASSEDAYGSRSARALAQTGPAVRELLLLEGAGNGTRILASRPDVIGTLVDWFSRTLL
jgi:alpha-beta hydrolase superfamily lysophospholipase